MELICFNCGNIFYDCEATFAIDVVSTPVGTLRHERMTCPCCGSDELESAAHCKICGASAHQDSLIGGYYCKECLEKEITEENAREYFQDSYALESFAEFIYEKGRKNKSGTGS